jgi:hypothetical protein
MTTPRVLDSIPVIGELEPDRIAAKLDELGDPNTAAEFRRAGAAAAGARGLLGWGKPKPWQYTSHQIGYLAPWTSGPAGAQPIKAVSDVSADTSLKGRRINVHLQRLRVFDYPGSGLHYVMLTFKAQNQLKDGPEPVGFSQAYRVQEGQEAGIVGYPVFLGLSVGDAGVSLQAATVNVKNDSDEKMLGFLESAPFTSGLNLLTTAQPALKPFTEMAVGLGKMVASRNQNVAVEEMFLGLDFTGNVMGARLAAGDYIVVQVPSPNTLNWGDWNFDPSVGNIVSTAADKTPIPYNYFVFAISAAP